MTSHVPTFEREGRETTAPPFYRGACSCGWRSPTGYSPRKGRSREEAKGLAQAEALEHARAQAA